MFGYIKAYKPEMRIKEYELYKAVYCSLCKEMGKSYGVFARFILSYDFTFLALLKASMNEKCFGLAKKACTCNPLKKCMYIDSTEELKMPAGAAIILFYYKILDNIHDEKGLKGLMYRVAKPLFSPAYKKASKEFPEIRQIASDFIEEQQNVEKNNCLNIDMAAEPTAKCLAQIFKTLSGDEPTARCLERVGYSIGRYIYILDAATDLEADIKTGRYNPLKEFEQKTDFMREFIEPQLNICIAEAAKAYELIDIKKFKNILDNIIYLGLNDVFKKELKL